MAIGEGHIQGNGGNLRVLSLFSGVGLGDLGLMMAGMDIVGQVEIDGYCQNILKLRWPDVPKWRDIKRVRPEDLPTADLISGGFPCQPFSLAGKQGGTIDDRYLWPEMFRIIKAKKPKYVLGENVPGIIKLGLDEVLSDLEGEGYSIRTFNIPACATDADHKRERIWILGYSGSSESGRLSGIGRKCLFEIGSTSKDVADSNATRQRRESRKKEIEVNVMADTPCHNGKRTVLSRSGRTELTNDCDVAYRERWRGLEPGICRVANGVRNRVDRLRALGNGQHVFTVYEIGRLIMEFNKLGPSR